MATQACHRQRGVGKRPGIGGEGPAPIQANMDPGLTLDSEAAAMSSRDSPSSNTSASPVAAQNLTSDGDSPLPGTWLYGVPLLITSASKEVNNGLDSVGVPRAQERNSISSTRKPVFPHLPRSWFTHGSEPLIELVPWLLPPWPPPPDNKYLRG